MSRADILDKIIATKRLEVETLKKSMPIERLREQARGELPRRGFLTNLKSVATATNHVALIAEVKKASPSKGVIRADFDPVTIARQYESGGATCLSVLTDVEYFQGSLDYLREIREAVSLPLLRKDFIIDRIQILEALVSGADAILLIAACLDPRHLHDLHDEASALGLDVLVEIHNEAEWEGIIKGGAAPPLVGINNRNLNTFEVDLAVSERLAPALVEAGCFVVAESGIYTPADVKRLKKSGASAILVGESLMRQRDPGVAARELLAT